MAQRLILMGEWGFPLTSRDLCYLIKAYLDGQGRTTRFVDNKPGPDFVKGYLKRNPRLAVRTANLIKRSRAELSKKIVDDFFDRCERVAAVIPKTHIFNCDETNLREHQGNHKALFRRGVKYAELVRDHEKNSTSVMFCGSAAGEMLPPYVVYKGANVYEAWSQRGPPGAVYSAMPSGWFDLFTYTDWFKVFLPHVRRLPGKKLLICDNLSSHVSLEVITLCRENDIEYVCLPPNSTDKMQPLDVGIFGPMKHHWRQQLRAYSERDPSAKLLQKTEFPRMLQDLMESISPKKLLPKAFEKCGLAPINRDKVLDRIPSILKSQDIASHVDQVLLEKLEVRKFRDGKTKKGRGKKVPAGDSYSTREEEEEEEEVVDQFSDEEMVSGSEEEMGVEVEDEEEEDDEELPDLEQTRVPGTVLVAIYVSEWFIAEVAKDQSKATSGYVNLSYTCIRGTNSFTWPSKPDIILTLEEDIVLEAVTVEPVNSRGNIGLKKRITKRFLPSWLWSYHPIILFPSLS